jgi:hypothetical protein
MNRRQFGRTLAGTALAAPALAALPVRTQSAPLEGEAPGVPFKISEGNLIEKLEKNIDKLGLVHAADVPGRHEPGSGEINYANIYKKLAALQFDRYLAMEFIPSGDPVESLRRARQEALRLGAQG